MATIVDDQPIFKHFCRICKKGFGCGRALGGHMRAHGIGEDNGHIEDGDPASDWEDKLGGNPPPGNKRMYALRTNPNRLKSCRVCENCGKEFLSWKSFLEHGKCSSFDVESLVSSPGSKDEDEDEDEDGDGDEVGRRGCGWSKGKRSKRPKMGDSSLNCPSSEEEDLANCLVMLSTARVDPLVAETEESCASASKDEERLNPVRVLPSTPNRMLDNKSKGVPKGMFECKACKKVFNSHQALGGHRASHKKVKGCFATKVNDLDDTLVEEDVITNEEFSIFPKSSATLPLDHPSQSTFTIPSKRKSKMHECSICHRIFSSGQALGGHKRCHWLTTNANANATHTSSIAKFHHFQDEGQNIPQRPKFDNSDTIDLNLPAPIDDTAQVRPDNKDTLSFEVPVPTEIYFQPWLGGHSNNGHENYQHHHNNKNATATATTTTTTNIKPLMPNVDDEADSKVKLAKLSDLKDMNLDGGSSPWLQVGIGSTSNVGTQV